MGISSNLFTALQKDIHAVANPKRAILSAGYFKTGPGEYGEGDVFLGLTVPEQRAIARRYLALGLTDVLKLLHNRVHEYRFVALVILATQFKRGTSTDQRDIVKAYLAHTSGINNWDLVDTSAPYILGPWLLDRDKKILYRLAKSRNIWERRVAILTTAYFIREGRFEDTLAIAEMLLTDTHDLIHKAVGWMLREMGKRSLATEEAFLKRHAARMPRTMLRYAIERFPETKRKHYRSLDH